MELASRKTILASGKATASTGRTYGCKRSDQTSKNSCGTGAVHIWVPASAGTTERELTLIPGIRSPETHHPFASDATHSISISIAGFGSALTTQVVRAGEGGGPNAEAYSPFIAATSEAPVKSTLTLTGSRKLAPASPSTRLTLRSSKPN